MHGAFTRQSSFWQMVHMHGQQIYKTHMSTQMFMQAGESIGLQQALSQHSYRQRRLWKQAGAQFGLATAPLAPSLVQQGCILKALSASSCPASHGRCCHSCALHLLKERWQCCFLFAQQTKARYAAPQLQQCCFAMRTGQAGTLPSEPRKALAHNALIMLLSMHTITQKCFLCLL